MNAERIIEILFDTIPVISPTIRIVREDGAENLFKLTVADPVVFEVIDAELRHE